MNLTVINHQSQRVLTTHQLAESYGTDSKTISYNFNHNVERYTEGKHFYLLEGPELRAFREIHDLPTNINKLYLWTEKGAWLHAKSLGTDQAWNAYEMLVDDYYRIKEQSPALSQSEYLLQVAQVMVQQEKKMLELENKQAQTTQQVQTIKEALLPTDKEWRKAINAKLNKVARACDSDYQGIREQSYQILEKRGACKLSIRVKNLKSRLSNGGATKTVVDKACKLDAIEADTRLKEIYSSIVRELVVKYVA